MNDVSEPVRLRERFFQVRGAMDEACRQAATDPSRVTLVAASKFRTAAEISALHRLGVHHFGENYPQEWRSKVPELSGLHPAIHWHMIGGVQRNKARWVADAEGVMVHSLDSLRLAQALDHARQQAMAAGRCTGPLDVLVQLSLTPQAPGRSGCDGAQLDRLFEAVGAMPGLRLRGIMGLPSRQLDRGPQFARLADARLQLARRLGVAEGGLELSMGMSHDFPEAIAAGATMIRVGEALFGPRPRKRTPS